MVKNDPTRLRDNLLPYVEASDLSMIPSSYYTLYTPCIHPLLPYIHLCTPVIHVYTPNTPPNTPYTPLNALKQHITQVHRPVRTTHRPAVFPAHPEGGARASEAAAPGAALLQQGRGDQVRCGDRGASIWGVHGHDGVATRRVLRPERVLREGPTVEVVDHRRSEADDHR